MNYLYLALMLVTLLLLAVTVWQYPVVLLLAAGYLAVSTFFKSRS